MGCIRGWSCIGSGSWGCVSGVCGSDHICCSSYHRLRCTDHLRSPSYHCLCSSNHVCSPDDVLTASCDICTTNNSICGTSDGSKLRSLPFHTWSRSTYKSSGTETSSGAQSSSKTSGEEGAPWLLPLSLTSIED